MQTIIYDGSFAGFLSGIFDIYEYKFKDTQYVRPVGYADPSCLSGPASSSRQPIGSSSSTNAASSSSPNRLIGSDDSTRFNDSAGTGHTMGLPTSLFSQPHHVVTSEDRALRIWRGIGKHISAQAARSIYAAFLSEKTGIEDVLFRYIKYIFDSRQSVEKDFSNENVLQVSKTAGKVHREKHRMEAFVRFKLTGDGLYYALVDPDFNVLPLISDHFQRRYADQRWMIYDTRRKYGIYYDLTGVTTVSVQFDEKTKSANSIIDLLDEKEGLYQELWQRYFASVNIPARKNTKLHIQHMPYRYWKHLTEKMPVRHRR